MLVFVLTFGARHAGAQTAGTADTDEPLPPPPSRPQSDPPAAEPAAPAPPAAPAARLPEASEGTTQLETAARPARSGLDDPDRNWYGWQLMINDSVALGTLGGGLAAGVKSNAALAVVIPAAVIFDLGGPTIHWLHGRGRIAAASFGVRVGVPFVGVLLGAALDGCASDQTVDARACRSRGAGFGALLGFAGATALDATLFAWDAPQPTTPRLARLAWTPFVAPRQAGAVLGVLGAF